MLKNLSIRTKTALGFGLILLVMASIVTFAIRGLQSSSDSFKTYRRLARSSVLSGRVQANMLMASRAAKNFLRSRDDQQLEIYNERFENARKFALEEQATLEDPQRREQSKTLVDELESYQRANLEVFQLMRRRDTILQETLNPQGLKMRENLTKIMVSANRDEDSEAAYLAGRALERVLLGRLYMFKFLEDNREADAERVRSELGSGFGQDYDQMVIAIDDSERKDLLQEFSTARDVYLTAFEEMVLTIQKRNTLIEQEVEPLDQSIADLSEQIKLSLKADQDKLGPSVQESNAATIRAVLIGSFIAVFLAILIAVLFIRTITRSISALGRSEAETERLSHEIAARKETEQRLAAALEEGKRINFLSDIALELTHCGYWHVDYSDPDYYFQSERAAQILGEPPREDGRYHLQDEWFARLVEANSETAELTKERYEGAIEGRYDSYDSTYAYKRPIDGKIIWLHAAGSVIRGEDGKTRYMYGVYQDVTDRVHAQQTLHDAKERLTHELAVARELSDAADREHQVWLLGESIAVRALREGVEAHAGSEDPVLLTGPPGAGQEAVARAIHRSSPRAGRPFIYVACPHVTAADDTAFGFRAANSEQPSAGKMSLADGGTLYLEGIEALSRSAQENLLKNLRDCTGQRAAGQKPVPDVRIIAHTSRDLTDAVQHGDFDSELANLLSARRLAVPSLAERRDDVISLANGIVTDRARSLGKALEGLSAESEERLLHYSWPGNLSELESVVERAVVLATGTSVDIPAELLREGRRVGGYTLVRQLGSGGMGEVWLARHALLARPSAVKLIRQEALQGDPDAREMLEQRFQREAQTTSQLRSPHTVELYDFGVTDDGGFYYVMEYLNGVDLESLVTRFGPAEPARAVFLLCQACMSLDEAHQAGLVHRDVKPANLFACHLGPHYDFLKLLDFGIVRTTSGAGQTVTSPGQIKGTPASLAPEVVQGEQAGFASDIYGLGCVAYWLLSGQHVFAAPNVMALLIQHVSQTPKPLSEHRSDVPSELDELVMRCLAKDPSDRPNGAFELGELLAAIPFDNAWNNRCAQSWWHANMPSPNDDAPAASWTETIIVSSGDTE